MNLSVLYGCDDNYAPYTGISMTSLFENNKDIEGEILSVSGDSVISSKSSRVYTRKRGKNNQHKNIFSLRLW